MSDQFRRFSDLGTQAFLRRSVTIPKMVVEHHLNHLESAGSQNDSPNEDKLDIMYDIDTSPPWYLSILLGIQHYLTMFGSTVAIPFIICPAMCMESDDPAKGNIISTILFVSGMVTLLQSSFGVRLPIIQGGTFAFIAPTIAILSLDKFKCPANFERVGLGNMTYVEKTEEWQIRMREIQGAIIVSSLVQIFLGFSGIAGSFLRFVTPLTITPAIAMVGLGLLEPASQFCAKHWGISMGTVMLMILLSQYLRNINIPCCKFLAIESLPIFKVFPVIMTILTMWSLCFVLTVTDVLEKGSYGRTDTKLKLLQDSTWFRVPYPFQWGLPTVHIGAVVGMIAGVIASAIESVGDYFACARLCGAPPPPTHAINRGIGVEGLGCMIAGIFGSGNGTTSYSENIGAIGVTKVGSRRVIQFGALVMIFFGLFPKFGSFFLTIPDPIVGGIFLTMFSIITGVGLSNLQYISLNSTRNMLILGISIFFPLMIQRWADNEDNQEKLETGFQFLDQVILIILKTGMFVGGVLGLFLDNTIPGSPDERGITKWNEHAKSGQDYSSSTYDIPFITTYLRRLVYPFYNYFFSTNPYFCIPSCDNTNSA
ncbi:solute carrier family 23 member 2 isoform X2 [Lepeophtheirus salmonis]|uniref:solute carrier family 23 member 2 isoform X2 n=1 Tax=Lepeophtheirus salmonis TaxID=72036 RepID=UPI003AF3C440